MQITVRDWFGIGSGGFGLGGHKHRCDDDKDDHGGTHGGNDQPCGMTEPADQPPH